MAQRAPAESGRHRRLSGWEAWALGGVVLLALVARTVLLAAVPPGLKAEEARHGLWAYAQHPTTPEAIAPPAGEPLSARLLIDGAATLFELLGASVVSLRLAPALLGTASVAALFLLARRLLGCSVAIGASALLATSRWHLRFSREVEPAVLLPLLAVLGVYLFDRYWDDGDGVSAAALGIVVGLVVCGGPAMMVPALAPLVLLAGVRVLTRREVALHRLRGLLLSALLAAALVAAFRPPPEAAEPPTSPRPAAEAIDLDQIRSALLAYWWEQPDIEAGLAGAALQSPVQAALLLVGLGLLLVRARREPGPAALLIGWLLVTVLPLGDRAGWGRAAGSATLGAVVPMVLISGAALEAVSRFAARRGRAAAIIVVAAPLIASAVLDGKEYFDHWATQPEVEAAFSGDAREFAEYLRSLAAGRQLYLSPFVYYAPNLRFLALGVELQLLAGPAALTFDRPPPRDVIYVIDNPILAAMVQQLYPEAREIRSFSVYGVDRGRFLQVDRQTVVAELGGEQRAEMVRLQYRLVQELRTRYEPSIWRAMSRDPAFLKQNLLPPGLLRYAGRSAGPPPVLVQ